jgi:hypothetical protein
MAKICPFSKRTWKYWLANYRIFGIDGLENKSTRQKRAIPKRRQEELRKETKQCALKIKWQLEKEKIKIHENTIHKWQSGKMPPNRPRDVLYKKQIQKPKRIENKNKSME